MKTTNSNTAWRGRFGSCARGLGLAAVVAMAWSGSATAQDKTIVMKMSTATLNDAQHEWMKRFAVAIEKNTNGRIKAEVYPASQLGTIPRQVEGTQLGSVQAWIGPPEFLVGLDNRFELLSVPGFFDTEAHGLRTIADPEFSKAFLDLGTKKGLVGASLFYTGPMAFDMRAPLRSLADVKGKKVRVLASPFQMEQLTRLGGTGVPMSLGDVLPAIQQGTLDGALSSVGVFSALHYYDSAKYMTETGHAYIFSVAMFSKRWYDGLPADLKPILMKTADEVRAQIIPWSLDFLVQERKTWVAKGGELLPLPAADQKELMAKMAPVGEDVVKAKPELKGIWELLKAAAKRTQ